MKIIVKQEFTDKFDHITSYPVGKELDFDEERCQDLIARGLAEVPTKDEMVDIKAPEISFEHTLEVPKERPKRNNKKK